MGDEDDDETVTPPEDANAVIEVLFTGASSQRENITNMKEAIDLNYVS